METVVTGEDRDRNKNKAMMLLAESGIELESLPKDLAAAIDSARGFPRFRMSRYCLWISRWAVSAYGKIMAIKQPSSEDSPPGKTKGSRNLSDNGDKKAAFIKLSGLQVPGGFTTQCEIRCTKMSSAAQRYYKVVEENRKLFNLVKILKVLSDPQKRAVYDQYGEEGLKGNVPPPNAAGGASYFSTGDGPASFRFNPRSADDIFAEFSVFSTPFDTIFV